MKLPRDLAAQELVRACKKLGYIETRQTGSHIRLTTQENGQHHITIPNHKPIKLGTLSAILTDIGSHFNLSKEDVAKALF